MFATGIGIGLAVGMILGWQVHKLYLRRLYRIGRAIRRKMRGQ